MLSNIYLHSFWSGPVESCIQKSNKLILYSAVRREENAT
jgi:hypothetical protein